MRVVLHMYMIVLEDRADELVFRVVDGLDDEPVVAREVEEGAGFSGGAEFGKDILLGEGEEVVCRIEVERFFAELTEDPGRVVLEFEVVFDGGRQFVSETVERSDEI